MQADFTIRTSPHQTTTVQQLTVLFSVTAIHDIDPKKSFIDYNRAGVGLMEIVTKPDFRSPEEAGAFLRKLRSIVRYLGTCDGNMDEGSMRCDASVSIRKVGETGFRPRCEVKNVNSVKFVMQAIEAEAKRQLEIYEKGESFEQESRQFDPASGITKFMRKKEYAHEYRQFPEPDLPPLILTDEFIEEIKSQLVELPDEKKRRYITQMGLTEDIFCFVSLHYKLDLLFQSFLVHFYHPMEL